MAGISTARPEYVTIGTVEDHHERFYINREYQRSDAWTLAKKQSLVLTVLQGLSIGMFYFYTRKGKPDVYEILDGQQRIVTIQKFLEGKFPTPPKTALPERLRYLANKTISDLKNDETYDELRAYRLYYIPISGGSEIELGDYFLALQEGQPLNTPEKLNGIQSGMKSFVVELAGHRMLTKSHIQDTRFTRRLIAAVCVFYLTQKKLDTTDLPRPPRYPELKEMYEAREHQEISKSLHRKMLGIMDFVADAMGDDIKIIKKKSDVPIIFLLGYHVQQRYVHPQTTFNGVVTELMTKVELAKLPSGQAKDNYEAYKALRKAGALQETFQMKFAIILHEFELAAAKAALPEKDPKRFHDYGEKLYVWYRDEKKCAHCGEEVAFEEISIDHFAKHADGGRTADLTNAKLLHKGKCHVEWETSKSKLAATS